CNKNLWYYKCNTIGCKQNISATKIHHHWEQTLTDLQIDPKFIAPITQNFVQTLKEESLNYENDRNELVKQVKAYKEQIKTIETNLALGKISEEIYQRVLKEIEEKLYPLQVELAKGIFKLSNHEKMVVNAVSNLSNLLTMWEKQDLMGKKLLAKTLYPKGILVDREKILYRTTNQNVFIAFIQGVTRGIADQQKSEIVNKNSAIPLW
ncbi:MAG: hypothetical protein VXX63_05250, partial [Bacteroidota bacterium]|nr:hypothetical protein [Bacteroidota bacterium]